MLREVVEPEVSSVADEHSENSAAVRRIADLPLDFVRHPVSDEALEPGSCSVDHAQSGVLGISDVRRRLDDPLEHTVERELGSDGDPRLHEGSQTL